MICGVLANIMGVLLFASFFYLYPTLYSALIGFILFNSTPFLMSAFRIFPVYKETHIFYKPKVYPLFIKKLSHYALVIIVGAIALPVTQMLLRDYIGQSLGWLSVGYWQAVLRISDAHMQFFGIVNLSVLLPYFSELNNHKQLNFKNTQVIKICLAIIIIACLSSLTLIILKDWVIYILYSHDFLVIAPFVLLQTIGDFFKVLLSLVVVVCLAKGYWKLALFSELLQALTLYVITMLFLSQYEMKALMFAYITSSLLSLMVISVLFWRQK
jgi:O-antigen/teichoic acid export membrane protein